MKTKFKNMSQQRVYIRNFIDRYYLGSKACCNCGEEPSTIVHNEKDPYNISFICEDCRLGLDKESLANLPKVNILENIEVNKKFSHSKNLVLDNKMKSILENAKTTEMSLLEYLSVNDLSYHKYRQALQKYDKEISPISKDIAKHFNHLRNKKIAITKQNTKIE